MAYRFGVVGHVPLRAAIFDVDGVLVDSPHEQAWRETLDRLMAGPWAPLALDSGYQPGSLTTERYRRAIAGRPRLDGARGGLEAVGVADPDDEHVHAYAAAKQSRLVDLIEREPPPVFDDAVMLLIGLRDLGLAVATASASRNAARLLAAISLPDGRLLRDVLDADVSGLDAQGSLIRRSSSRRRVAWDAPRRSASWSRTPPPGSRRRVAAVCPASQSPEAAMPTSCGQAAPYLCWTGSIGSSLASFSDASRDVRNSIGSRSRAHRVATLRVEEQRVVKRHGEPLTAAGLEPCLERELGNNLGVAEPQVRELLVTEVLNHLNCRVIVRAVWLAVSELRMLGAEPDELPGEPPIPTPRTPEGRRFIAGDPMNVATNVFAGLT